MIVCKKTGKASKIIDEGGLYTYPIWTKRRKREGKSKDPNAMDVSMVNQGMEDETGIEEVF